MKIAMLAPAAGLLLAAVFGFAPSTPWVVRTVPASLELADSGGMVTRAAVPLAASRWCDSAVVTNTPGGHQVLILGCTVTPAESTSLRRVLASMTRAIPLYGRLTGVPYPYSQYKMHFKPSKGDGGGGVANMGGMNFVGPLPNIVTEHDRPVSTAKILVHELAHQWGRGTGWLSEGFSDFMAGQVWGAEQGPRGEEEFLFFYNTRWSTEMNKAPVNKLEHAVIPSGWYSIPWPGAEIWRESVIGDQYYGGAVVLWMLKQYLGEKRFWASMHTYLSGERQQDATATGLQQAIKTTTGEDLDWFFKEWVNGTGYPRFTVATTYDAAAHQVTMQVTQAAPVFRMPVTVRVRTVRGDVFAHATLDAPAQTIVVNGVAEPPAFVVFDDGDAIVKTLQFAQPTAWLVAQLRQEARPWQTWWAIEQLGQRAAADSVAAAALITAVRKGQYALTRAQAAVALGAVATPAVVATLTQGVRDTSVIVRRGALRALYTIGTPAALAVERSAFVHDSSESVRADAVRYVLMAPATPPAERQALFAQALAQESDWNAIRVGAIRVVLLNGCDSSSMATLHTAQDDPDVLRGVTAAVRTIDPSLDVTPACQQLFTSLRSSRESP